MGMIVTLWRVPQAQLDHYLNDSSFLEEAVNTEGFWSSDDLMDLDKAWDGLLFLLTGEGVGGTGHVLRPVYLTGQLIDPEQDFGAGPAHYLKASDVALVNQHLQKQTAETLEAHYDADALMAAAIYPTAWAEDDAFYLVDAYRRLQTFYQTATEAEQAVISFIG